MSSLLKNPIVHGVVTVLLFILPTVLAQAGSWQSMTLGGILVAIVKALENVNSGLTVAGHAK